MRYINSTLPDNEKIILEVELHWIRKFLAWFYLIFFGIFIIGIYLFIKIMIENWNRTGHHGKACNQKNRLDQALY